MVRRPADYRIIRVRVLGGVPNLFTPNKEDTLKITVECTPEEVREMCGSKQLEGFQNKLMDEVLESVVPESVGSVKTALESYMNMWNPLKK